MSLNTQRKVYYTLLSAGAFVAAHQLPQPYATLGFAALVFALMTDGLPLLLEVAFVALAIAVSRLYPKNRK